MAVLLNSPETFYTSDISSTTNVDHNNSWGIAAFAIAGLPLVLASCAPANSAPSTTPRPSERAPAPRSTQQSPTATPLPSALKDMPPLSQTAVALDRKGLTTSFQEEAGFTQEMFETIRRGTFLLMVRGDKSDNLATAWLAKINGNTYYLVTPKHMKDDIDNISEICFWRPNLDTKVACATSGGMQLSGKSDLMVIKANNVDYRTSVPLQPLAWKDNAKLEEGDKVLTVGFPGEFTSDRPITKEKTMGEVITILTGFSLFHPAPNQWEAEGLVNYGLSGGPIVINQNGRPVVVGMVTEKSSDWTHLFSKPRAFGYYLDVANLIKLVDENF